MANLGTPIVLGNDFRALAYIDTLDTANPPEREAATGLTDVTVRLAATETGAAIHANLSKAAAELGSTGYYSAVFEGSDIDTHLAAYAGLIVYQVWANTGVDIKNRVVGRKVLASEGA